MDGAVFGEHRSFIRLAGERDPQDKLKPAMKKK
jgi:hypothetical protein